MMSNYIKKKSLKLFGLNSQPLLKTFTNEENSYIPFYALFNGKLIKSVKNGVEKEIFTYNKINLDIKNLSIQLPDKKYFQIRDTLINCSELYFSKTSRNEQFNYIATKGYLGFYLNNVIEPLFILCVQKSEISKIADDYIDVSKFVLIINSKFLTEEHKIMYKNIRKIYIQGLIDEGVDVVYSKEIDKWCFNNSKYVPKFKSVFDMKQYLETINSEIIKHEVFK